MRLLEGGNAFRGGQEAEEPDSRRAVGRHPVECRYGRVAGGQHRVHHDDHPTLQRRELAVVLDRLKGLVVAVEPHMADPGRRQHLQDPVQQAVAGPED